MARHFVVVIALCDLALHIGILVLHHAGHQRTVGVEKARQFRARIADVGFHQLRCGEAHVLDGVGGEKTVLDAQERRA
jgi:hypothetical protein